MAVVQGVKEKVHLPIYDSLTVEPEKQLRDAENTGVLKFFVNVQGKTKLETNLQSASLLPHYNTFEARAMRVVISDLPPVFPDKPTAKDEDLDVVDENDTVITATVDPNNGTVTIPGANPAAVTADIELGLDRLMELLKEGRDSDDGFAELPVDEEGVALKTSAGVISRDQEIAKVADAGGVIFLSIADLEFLIEEELEDKKKSPPREQLRPNDGAGNFISKLIYNTVTTLYVGEKIMIQMPTWFFPAGAGPYSETDKFTTHGEPSPMATFRFAEPVYVDKNQNFRVEIEIPDSDVLKEIQRAYGPLNIWVVLDGYMTRDVQ
ncbi:MAG TPA: hypothetical protein VJ692_07235 [Nitrospiraceae bacterium]|nr:hypothetical protein [Nitrospiraceae bacterium]